MLSGAASNIGELHLEFSQPNQDNFLLNDEKQIYAVFDGHGDQGHLISAYLKHNLAPTFSASLHPAQPIEESFRHAFHVLDENICKSTQSESSGSTCVMAYVNNNNLYVAGVGDCTAILVQVNPSTGKIDTTALLSLHKVNNATEHERILKTGAQVAGDYIVCMSDPNKVINMTRAFGDQDMKSAGIISLPDISVTKLPHTTPTNAIPQQSDSNTFCFEVGDERIIGQGNGNGKVNGNGIENGNHNSDSDTNSDSGDNSSGNDSSNDQRSGVTNCNTKEDANNAYTANNGADNDQPQSSVTHFDATIPSTTTFDTFLILSSDGLEQVESFDEIARKAHQLLKAQIKADKGGALQVSAMCSNLLQQLEDFVYDRDGMGFNDDTTVIVVLLSGFSLAPPPPPTPLPSPSCTPIDA